MASVHWDVDEEETVNEALYGTVDDMPAAQDNSHLHAIRDLPQFDEDKVLIQQEKGCWFRTKRFIRGLWATRMTEETKTDRELYIKTTVRELAIYIVFLIILSILSFGMTNPDVYYFTRGMKDIFVDAMFPDSRLSFRTLNHQLDFWRFIETPYLDGMYPETYYNGQNLPDNELGFVAYENKLLGVPRLRQLRVTNTSCEIHEDFKDVIPNCYDIYTRSVEETVNFGIMERNHKPKAELERNETAWVYFTEEELDGSSHWGKVGTYGGGGYVQLLSNRRNESELFLQKLKQNFWIGRGTRAVFFDFTLYNANVNLFCVIKLLVEFPATGGAIPSWSFRTVKLIRYVSTFDYFIAGCEIIFILFVFYYTVEESIEIRIHKCSYFTQFWNILDVIVLLISYVCIAFNIFRTLYVTILLDDLLSKLDDYINFEFLGFWQTQFNYGVGICVFFAWFKTFKYVSFNKTMTQLSSTLSKCAKDIGGFAIMFFIIFFAFAQLGYLIFGSQVKAFSKFSDAIFTCMRLTLGDFDFVELEKTNRILGPLYFCCYVFFLFFILLNMFLAIINDAYADVKDEISKQKNEFEISDYFKRGLDNLKKKFQKKERDEVGDLHDVLQRHGFSSDSVIEFNEWRQQLKKKGYADAEIETVFSKYDTDGDRVLDQVEQRRMLIELEQKHKKSNRQKELDDIEENENEEEFDYDSFDRDLVPYEEFDGVNKRVDRMEHSVGIIVVKIDSVLVKLDAMEKAKLKHAERMNKYEGWEPPSGNRIAAADIHENDDENGEFIDQLPEVDA